MKLVAYIVWVASVIAGLFWQPLLTAVTTISLTTMLLCVALVLIDIREGLRAIRPAPRERVIGQVAMFSEPPKRPLEEPETTAMYYGRKRS